jgi:hypothetical protein
MRPPLLALAVVATSGAAHAQNAREPIAIDPGAGTFAPAIASDGDLSAVLVCDFGDVRISTSDGRGTAWTTPVSITSGAASFSSTRSDNERMLAVVGNTIYAVWLDNRNDDGSSPAENDLFLAVSTDGGATFAPEITVPKGFPAGTGAVRDFRFRVAPGTGGAPDTLYVLQTVDPASDDEKLFIATSTDGGASFLPAVEVPQGSRGDVDEFGVAVDGDDVYVAWVDDRSGGTDDLFFQKSDDAGQTWESIDRIIDGTGYGVGDVADLVDVEVAGSKVAVAWGEEDSGTGGEILHLTVSNDGGDTFGPVLTLGGYTPEVDDVDGVDLEMAADGRIYLAWEDDRTGSDEVYVLFTDDDGATVTENKVSIGTNAAFPQLVLATDADNTEQVFVQWTEDVGSDDELYGAVSFDAGLTFGTPVRLSPVGSDNDFGYAAYNPLYNNFLAVYEQNPTGGDETFVGGLRPQSLDVSGVVPGPTSLTFDLSGFPTTDLFGALLGSQSAGSLALPEVAARNTGLTFDALTDLTLTFPFIPLSGGTGSTTPIPANVPAGTTFLFSAVSIAPSVGIVTFGELTDVETVTF